MSNWPQLTSGEMTALIFATWVVLMVWVFNTKDPRRDNRKSD